MLSTLRKQQRTRKILPRKKTGLKEHEEFCSLSFSDAGKELGKRWNDLNAESKEVYEIRSKTEKMEYKQNMENYKPSDEFLFISNKPTGKIKKIKDANAPKKPASAFLRWSSVQREELNEELAIGASFCY